MFHVKNKIPNHSTTPSTISALTKINRQRISKNYTFSHPRGEISISTPPPKNCSDPSLIVTLALFIASIKSHYHVSIRDVLDAWSLFIERRFLLPPLLRVSDLEGGVGRPCSSITAEACHKSVQKAASVRTVNWYSRCP